MPGRTPGFAYRRREFTEMTSAIIRPGVVFHIWRDTNWFVRICAVIAIVFTIVAITGTALAPYDPNLIDLSSRLKAPDLHYWLGPDHLGRDKLSCLVSGPDRKTD